MQTACLACRSKPRTAIVKVMLTLDLEATAPPGPDTGDIQAEFLDDGVLQLDPSGSLCFPSVNDRDEELETLRSVAKDEQKRKAPKVEEDEQAEGGAAVGAGGGTV